MKRVSLQWKIMIPVYFVIIFFIIGILIQFRFLRTASDKLSDMHDHYFQATVKSDELKLSIVQIQQWLTDVSATKDTDGLQKADAYAVKVRGLLQELPTLIPKEKGLIDQIGKDFEPFYEIGIQMARIYIEKGTEAGNLKMEEFDVAAEALDKSVEEYLTIVDHDVESSMKGIHNSLQQAIFFVVGMVIAAFFLTGFVFIAVLNRVIKPVLRINHMAAELEQGNLSITSECKQNDEIGDLSAGMNRTAMILNRYIREIGAYTKELEQGNLHAALADDFSGDFVALQESLKHVGDALHEIMEQIHVTSDGVASGAEQVAIGAQSLASGSAEQSHSIEELHTAIAVTSDKILSAAETAQEANDKVNTVGSVARTSNEQMHAMIGAMDKISESSNQIGKIIKTIEDIAFQTNILALNAAVEAARAGEAGKGFAVVADEVRSLASKSAEAAQNTTVLIEDSIHAVENGVHIANETAESLNMVVDGVAEVIATISGISDVLQQQTSGIESIRANIESISNVTQTISTTAEENGAASEELSGQSDRLKELVNRFQLRN